MQRSKKIEKKVWPEYFQAIADGKKNYELRLNDFDAAEGDTLVLKEWDPQHKQYTGRELKREISYVGTFDINELFWPKDEIEKHGLQILSLK